MALPGTTPASWRRLVRQIHLWVGLLLCLPLAILGLTGSVLVFDDELHRLFDRAPEHAAAQGEPRPVAEILAAARAAAPPGFVPSLYIAPAAPGDQASVRMMPPRKPSGPGFGGIRVDIDPVSLRVLASPRMSAVLDAIHAVHSTLYWHDRHVVGWLGVVMLALGVSGLVNWWPRATRWRAAFAVRRGAGAVALHRDLHGVIGVWALVVFMTVSVSGVYLAFPQSVRTAINLVLPAGDLRAAAAALRVTPRDGAAPMTVDDAITLAESQIGGARLGFVALSTQPDRPFRIALRRAGQERGAPMVTVFIDPWARKILRVSDPRDYTIGETMLAWQHALHAGEGLGWVWKFLVFLSGFLPLLFAITGVSMWWLKRRVRRARGVRSGVAGDPLYSARRAGE